MANKKLIYSFDFKKLLNEKIKQYPQGSTQRDMIYAVLQWLDKVPRVDAEPVRHGSWGRYVVVGYNGLISVWARPCSECGYEHKGFVSNYCPNCGAKMNKEAI